ncbi:MAG: protein-glutamate O-methyltransferase CheR [Magnetococcales bacterium]|nr:protein-glutamate O-methyltransferase CheR [Magnetococcales bacterium]
MDSEAEIENLEMRLLLETIFLRYGYDFRQYAQASLKRRMRQCLSECGITLISEAIPKVIHDRTFLNRLVHALSVTVTHFFRDPLFYRTLRKQVIPMLATYPFVTIWHAGCATGEEVYSLAILLREEGLYERVRIFATDINDHSLQIAKEGIYNINSMIESSQGYLDSAGKGALSDYYHSRYDLARIHSALKENIVFAAHNLATDHVFSETHLIFCRNVLIYFNKELTDRVLLLFEKSLVAGGVLCLGSHESLSFTAVENRFIPISRDQRIYQKKVGP